MIGDNIKRLRQLKGLSINALARLCKTSPGYLSDIEKGHKGQPSMNMLEKIAIALEVELTELVKNNDQSEFDQIEQDFIFIKEKLKKLSKSDRDKVLKMIEIFEEEGKK